MRYSGNTYAIDWYAYLMPDAEDSPGGLAAVLLLEDPPMEPKQRTGRREWLARREPELITQDALR